MMRKIWVITAIILITVSECVPALAVSSVPYHTYNYDYWGYIYYTPAAYIPQGTFPEQVREAVRLIIRRTYSWLMTGGFMSPIPATTA
ncbi:hypothetical protein [Thermoclostridium stercorarium]|uniref:hypothetical protein n=1 Tax=Thermoclostridium stercorarium TaxID=1510 RepID=UPI000AC49AFA|nr:hypothetical protein [Thermoclostridium stercorarium]